MVNSYQRLDPCLKANYPSDAATLHGNHCPDVFLEGSEMQMKSPALLSLALPLCFLAACSSNPVDLRTALREGDLDFVKKQVTTSEAANKRDGAGFSPLHHASFKGHKDIVEYLISVGAPIEGVTNNGFTALHKAAEGGHMDVVQVLLQSGALINARTRLGATPLDLARVEGHTGVVDYLLQQGEAVRSNASQ